MTSLSATAAPNENLCACSFGPYKIHYFPVTYAQEIKCFQHSSVLAVMEMWPQLQGYYVKAKTYTFSNTILNTTTSAVLCTLQLSVRGDVLQRCCCYMGACIDQESGGCGWQPLHFSAERGDNFMPRHLLEKKAKMSIGRPKRVRWMNVILPSPKFSPNFTAGIAL